MNTIAAVFKRTSTSSIALAIFVIASFFYLLFSHLMPVTDPVESNYALTAKEMVLSSDWISPQIYGHPWYDKPAFFYWLTAAAFKLFGFSELAARLTPAVFAALGLVLVYIFTAKFFSKSMALMAVLVMGTSVEYVFLSKLIITDMVFFLFNSTALVFFYFGYVGVNNTKRWYLLVYASLALAVLTKGPVGLLLPGLVMFIFIALERNWRELKAMSIPMGIVIFCVIALPWYLAMYMKHGSDFINTFLGVHNYLRATVSEHPKDNVSYYYVVVFMLSMLPWSPMAVRGLYESVKHLRAKPSPLLLFCLIWTAAYFVFYTLMATKYLTYTFPILFPVTILTVVSLDNLVTQARKRALIYWAGIPLVLVTLLYIAASYHYVKGSTRMLAVGIMLSTLLFAYWQIKGKSAKYVFAVLCTCQVVTYITLSAFVFPAVAVTKTGKEIAETMFDYGVKQVAFYQFYSTSAVYYSGIVAVELEQSLPAAQPEQALSWTSKYTMPVDTLEHFMNAGGDKIVIVPDNKREQFLREANAFKPHLLVHSNGYNYYSGSSK